MTVFTRTLGQSLRIANLLVTRQSIDGNSITLSLNLPDNTRIETSTRYGVAWLDGSSWSNLVKQARGSTGHDAIQRVRSLPFRQCQR